LKPPSRPDESGSRTIILRNQDDGGVYLQGLFISRDFADRGRKKIQNIVPNLRISASYIVRRREKPRGQKKN
jgi:hypothetical protein